METYALDRIQARRHKRRRALLAILLSSSLATLGAGAMSLAVFTDSEAATGSWTTGTVDLTLSAPLGFSAAGILPGDTGEATIVVANSGTAELRYAVRTVGADALGNVLLVTVREGACPSTGTVLESDAANTIAVGSNAQGADAGDRVLAAGASESLCFGWDLPIGTDNTYEGASATVDYWFDAEQTRNN